jgi:hypothetical protein
MPAGERQQAHHANTNPQVKSMVNVHAYPLDDLIDHELEGDECLCGPAVLFEAGGQVIVHHSLDGRELDEP